jgi:hypothetical protein
VLWRPIVSGEPDASEEDIASIFSNFPPASAGFLSFIDIEDGSNVYDRNI